MEKYYVYIHLNPKNNEIFYVGKGSGDRKYSKNRNQNWLDYIAKLENPHKILVLKDNLTEKESIELEEKILKKVDFNFNDLTTNIDKSEQTFGIKFEYNIENEKNETKPRFENYTDSQIIESLLSFPNENFFNEISEEFEKRYELVRKNYDELEEIDEDIFIDIESVMDSIDDLITEYRVSDIDKVPEFISDLEREKVEIEFIIEQNPKKLQKHFINALLIWVDKIIKTTGNTV